MISVLLPVHNAAAFLSEALASLVEQTCRDFEVVAVNDGSTDQSGALLQQYAESNPWLVVLHQEKSGIAVALNRAYAVSRGRLIARMDADDIAEPRRLELQAEFLQTHPEVGVCGAWARTFGNGPETVIRAPVADDAIRAWLVFGSAFVHPAVMMRRDVLAQLTRPYEPAAPPLEDYTLWLVLSGLTRFHNLPKVLLRYRRHPDQVTRPNQTHAGEELLRLRVGLLSRLGIDCNAVERRAHAALGLEPAHGARPKSQEVATWLKRLREAVPATGWCSPAALRAECAEAWWRFMRSGAGGPVEAWRYLSASVARPTLKTCFRVVRLALR